MNDGKIIIDKIIEKAKSEAQAIEKKARLEAEAIDRSAQEKARREEEIYKKNAADEATKAKAKAISGAELKGKIALLDTKQQILDEVISEAKDRLEALPDEEYSKTIGSMLENIKKEQDTVIIVSAKDRGRLAGIIEAKGFALSDEERDIAGGFIVKCGDIEYNYSFESIISVEEEEIRQIAAKILF